jgi:hypothetical protein
MTALLVAAVGALFSGSMIQAAQDLSGTWVVIPERSTWTNSDGHTQHIRVFGERFTAVLTSDDLTIVLEDEGVPRQYLLDHEPHVVLHPSKTGFEKMQATAGWHGPRLLITMRMLELDAAETPPETSRSLQLRPDGTLLVLAPWGADGQPIGTVYRRQH